jgi:hypothetical protein
VKILAEPDKQTIGDGSDNPMQAAQKLGQAARQFGQ